MFFFIFFLLLKALYIKVSLVKKRSIKVSLILLIQLISRKLQSIVLLSRLSIILFKSISIILFSLELLLKNNKSLNNRLSNSSSLVLNNSFKVLILILILLKLKVSSSIFDIGLKALILLILQLLSLFLNRYISIKQLELLIVRYFSRIVLKQLVLLVISLVLNSLQIKASKQSLVLQIYFEVILLILFSLINIIELLVLL